MLKLLVILLGNILVGPILCDQEGQHIYDGNKKKLVVEGSSEEMFRRQCKNLSDTDIDISRNDLLYEEFKVCAKEAIDMEQFENEAKIMGRYIGWGKNDVNILRSMQQHFNSIEMFIQKYCLNLTKYFPCDDILSPIYSECYTVKERQTQTIAKNYIKRGLNYLCENNAFTAIKFINGKILQCGYLKQSEFYECFNPIAESQAGRKQNHFIDPDIFCGMFNTFRDCIVPVIEGCELSESPGKLLTFLYEHIQREHTCVGIGNFTGNPTSFEV